MNYSKRRVGYLNYFSVALGPLLSEPLLLFLPTFRGVRWVEDGDGVLLWLLFPLLEIRYWMVIQSGSELVVEEVASFHASNTSFKERNIA